MAEVPGAVLPEERSRPIRCIKFLLFSAAVIPAVVAGALAWADGYGDLPRWLLAALGLLLGQAGADYFYYHFTGYHTDSRDAHARIFAGWRPLLVGSLLHKEHSVWAGFACLFAALLLGAYFFVQLGATVLWFVAAGGGVSIFFTPLMLRGLKETVIFLTFGPLCMAAVDFVLTERLRPEPLAASLPVGFLVTVVAYLKGARYKVVEEGGMEVILNLKPGLAGLLMLLAYLALAAVALVGPLPPWTLLGLLTVPLSALLYRKLHTQKSIADYLWATVLALVIFIATGLLMAVGLFFSRGS